ncbi:DUF3429 domain-containing protein [Maritimibacter sp. 55A14]|uniref:DUF3429 domain-containing protein n=1 Tax=Maritimibacter sp. 55A14 TaxID=2174844 RepID=UPI000D60D787|nr:DUF3429 domain-containing protein [Maritimibacter sp. 55A14]PWE32485.1 DUF3429 domain-containing protein [Maritimibacter sp. 55A14]
MTGIPRTALLLTAAGALPFLWGAAMALAPDPAALPFAREMPAALRDEFVLSRYGLVILCFMAGVHWGFAARASGSKAALGYAVSVVPALWAFFTLGGAQHMNMVYLAVGFLGLLAADWGFWRARLAPSWWMRLRLPVTLVVLACLVAGVAG